MSQNKLIFTGIVLIALAFFGGMKYAGSKTAQASSARGQFSGTGRAWAGGRMNGGTFGTVLSKDDKSITIQTGASGSKIVFYSTSTPVMKSASGSVNDIVVGSNVAVTGATNTDGSLNASSIQVRPENQNRQGN